MPLPRPTRLRPLAALLAASVLSPALADTLLVPAEYPSPQAAINASADGDVVVLAPGTYPPFNPIGRAITVRSEDPSDAAVVANTVIDAGGAQSAIVLISGERRDTVIEGLTITGGSSSYGGGLAMLASDPTVRDCVITGNTATTQGGGIYVSMAAPLFERCRIEGNTAPRGGGAATIMTTFARFEGCTFHDNTASTDGGGLFHSGGPYFVRVNRCTFTENSAGALGGAIAFNSAPGEVVGCLIRNNTADQGAGISWFDIGSRVLNSTIVNNTATFDGGGFWGFQVQPIVRNCIVRGNTPNSDGGFSSDIVIEYCNYEGGGDANTIDVDPQFVDPANGDFRLSPTSPSVNTGFNGWVPSHSIDDFDGTPRIQDGQVDMGAFETAGAPPERAPVRGSLVAAMKDNYHILFGLDMPIVVYDPETGAWSEFLRNMPTFSIAADPEEGCFWVHNGETFTLGRIPYDTRRLEEVAVMKYLNQLSAAMSGMAVRNGVLYGVNTFPSIEQPKGLYEIDKVTGVATLRFAFPDEFLNTDLHYDPATDRMLLLSTAESIPPGDPLGIFEIDLDTYEITVVQSWFNSNPFEQAGALSGLAVGGGRHWIFRSQYNALESWDADTLQLVETLTLPPWYPAGDTGLILSGLTWEPSFATTACPGDLDDDGAVGLSDLLVVLAAWDSRNANADLDGDGVVGLSDLIALLAAWGPCPN